VRVSAPSHGNTLILHALAEAMTTAAMRWMAFYQSAQLFVPGASVLDDLIDWTALCGSLYLFRIAL
jgi:hypothetical protein